MRRILVLSLLVVSVAVALAAASYSALAGSGPVAGVAGVVVGAEIADEGDVVNAVDADDVDGDDVNGQNSDNDGEGARDIAGLIAAQFGVDEADVWTRHEQDGIGFGALFKLYALAAVMEGTSVDDLVTAASTGVDSGYEFNFGELRKSLTTVQAEALESGPKNLGQLVSASHGPDGAGPDADGEPVAMGLEEAREKFAAHASQGKGPPAEVPAHGRN